ncbi:MAG: transporter [Rhodocyclaceae bacterium]|nr:transporter [Rhodocyclaceae bacterium]
MRIIHAMFAILRLISLLLPALASHAAVNDVMPGDYFPLQPGQTTLTVYAYDREFQGPYASGRQTFDGRIDSTVLALRAARGFRVGDTTVAGVAVLPWSDSRVSPAPLATALGAQAKGLSDLRLGLTAWLINDKATANYLGISGMLIAPTGDYDGRQVLNAGENRWRYVVSAGWQKDITPRFLVELSPEIAFYGDNKDYAGKRRLEQRTSYAITGYLRWRVTPAWHVHVGGQLNRGGETRINGVDQRNPANNERVMAGMSWFLPEQQQVILRFARDTEIDNGFRTGREILLRYQKGF